MNPWFGTYERTSGELDYVYNLKDTYGAREGKKMAVPNYLAGRISFSLGA